MRFYRFLVEKKIKNKKNHHQELSDHYGYHVSQKKISFFFEFFLEEYANI
jgi:hypothetical protein